MSTYQSQFAPYAPPPDVQAAPPDAASTPSRFKRPWFPAHNSSQHVISSYQSGDIPTFNDSQGGGSGVEEAQESQISQWETRFGLRVDALAAFAYALGPLSALLLIVVETHNDYVRFHAYQSALLSGPLLVFCMFASLVGFTPWLRTLITATVVLILAYMAFRAFVDASRNTLERYQLPFIGQLADDWVSQE